MCGRFALFHTVMRQILDGLRAEIGAIDVADAAVSAHPSRYNIAPTQAILVVRQDEAGKPCAQMMRWGLVPSWVKDPREFSLIVNARAETLDQKPSFRGSLRHHRCLVPASGYYEWQKRPEGGKQPFFIANRDGAPMHFAGLYATWLGPDGEEIDTVAIVTVPANPELEPIHDRTPALIPNALLRDWLDVRHVDAKQAQAMLGPAPLGQVTARPVSTRVNSVFHDGPELIAPVRPEKPAPPPEPAETNKPKPSKPARKKSAGQMDMF